MASPHPGVGTGLEAAGYHVVEVVVGGRRYALPLESVERLHRMVDITPVPDASPLVLGVVNVAGVVLPVLDLRRRLGHGRSPCGLDDRLLVLRHGSRRVLVPVEGVGGVVRVKEDDLAPPPGPAGPETPATAVLERGGELSVLLDPAALFPREMWDGPGTGGAAPAEGSGER